MDRYGWVEGARHMTRKILPMVTHWVDEYRYWIDKEVGLGVALLPQEVFLLGSLCVCVMVRSQVEGWSQPQQ